jgi:chemotaxis response regulator CheB
MSRINSQFIVAIGGSAGCLEALIQFFNHTALDNASYIIIRHMPQSYISHLKGILTPHSKLEILNVDKATPLKVNTIYIGPGNKNIIIKDGWLDLVERTGTIPNYSVDIFFKSLAQQQIGKRAIGVVLAGVGFDGSKGARYIKEAGGMVIAQQPTSCIHNSMPKHVIESGFVDYVELPANMPDVIEHFVMKTEPTS